MIFFSPEDLNIIKNGPAERRRFVDLELCQLNRLYVYNLAQYNKTVIQRNKLLKDIDYNTSLKETLPMWNEQLLKYGTELIIMRSEFIKELNPLIAGDPCGTVGRKGNTLYRLRAECDGGKFQGTAREEPVSGDQAEADSDRSAPR